MGRVDFVTASRERTDFSVPAQIGDVIELAGSVHRVGRSSLSVQIDMAAETPSSGECRSCSHGLFNIVAIGLENTDGVLPSLRNIAAARGDCGILSTAVEIVFLRKPTIMATFTAGPRARGHGKVSLHHGLRTIVVKPW